MILEAIPIHIEFGSNKVEGSILKLNPTGMLVELEKIPFQVGNEVRVSFIIEGIGQFSAQARPIKSYDNYKKKVRVDTEDGPKIEEQVMKLSELHFVNPSEELRSGIMRYLMNLQVSQLKNTK